MLAKYTKAKQVLKGTVKEAEYQNQIVVLLLTIKKILEKYVAVLHEGQEPRGTVDCASDADYF